KFLSLEREWKLKKEFQNTAVFMKLKNGSHDKWWKEQPYMVRHSKVAKTTITSKIKTSTAKLMRKNRFSTLILEKIKKIK
ncbi:unnamed protein product, partial [marine sediment metagenome]